MEVGIGVIHYRREGSKYVFDPRPPFDGPFFERKCTPHVKKFLGPFFKKNWRFLVAQQQKMPTAGEKGNPFFWAPKTRRAKNFQTNISSFSSDDPPKKFGDYLRGKNYFQPKHKKKTLETILNVICTKCLKQIKSCKLALMTRIIF